MNNSLNSLSRRRLIIAILLAVIIMQTIAIICLSVTSCSATPQGYVEPVTQLGQPIAKDRNLKIKIECDGYDRTYNDRITVYLQTDEELSSIKEQFTIDDKSLVIDAQLIKSDSILIATASPSRLLTKSGKIMQADSVEVFPDDNEVIVRYEDIDYELSDDEFAEVKSQSVVESE